MPFINAHGITQYYHAQGEGPPLVFIHGALVDHESWLPQLEAFQRTHRVLAHDLRGHGRTGPSDRPDYSVELFADDLRALLQALVVEAPLLCGLSLGGMIGQAYAARYPVAGLVLADTLVSIAESRREAVIRRLAYPRRLIALAIRSLNPDRFARLALWLAELAQGSHWLEQDTRRYVRNCMGRMPGQEVLKTFDAIYRFRRQPLQRIDCPVLVVNGEREAGIVRRHADVIVDRLPQAQFEQIPGAGHLSNLDNPLAFNELLGEFARQVAQATIGVD